MKYFKRNRKYKRELNGCFKTKRTIEVKKNT